MTRRARGGGPRIARVAVALLIAVAGAGCTADPGTGTAATFVTPSPPDGSERATGAPTGDPVDSEATAADVAFVATMVVHHEQAVELAELAPGRARDPEVAELAARMALVQEAEADAMRTWLERRDSRDDMGTGHDLAEGMAGEISSSTIDRAAELDGAAFDRLFVQAMIPHHRGAVEMAEARLAEAGDPAVTRWARAIATAQALEIDRLLEIEARLPAG
ncbi:DUF305 domain-containing protein [Agromyces sp. Soil535]|uniref:DUF305 domain-containing protein n=1 Tax=Agromyces sp. Soil535 TaxID=1736390 RepID=UPI000AC65795|nr:DUF305 domain-containing protein [Agromyces sp. Soil535]